MSVTEAPQWLLPAYMRSVKALGASAPVEDIRSSGEQLISMWSTEDRHFHGLKHVINMLARVDELADESHSPDIMRLAAWYHGCRFSASAEETYRRNGGEDEVSSAAYAAEDLYALGLPEKTVDRVCALILNLKRHNLPSNDIDARALNDADLGALAVQPQQYRTYREQVRAEYEHIPPEDYLRARLAIVTRLLARDQLFSSPLGESWELPARQNLEAERTRLQEELACRSGKGKRPTGEIPAVVTGEQPAVAADAPDGSAGEDAAAEEPEAPQGTPARVVRTSILSKAESLPPTAPGPAAAAAAAPRTPASGVPASARPDPEATPEHTTTMESCVDDLDRLLKAPRTPKDGVPAQPPSRAAIVEEERAKMAERLRRKTAEAKILREARTGEFQAIQAEVVDDGQGGDPAER